MNDILKNLNRVSSYGSFQVEIPGTDLGLNNSISGTLELSRRGYVYSAPSKTVVWLKFLSLAFYLPLKGIAFKCTELAKKQLGYAVPVKGFHDLDHMFHIAKIAWKGVMNPDCLLERIEECALAELDYNYVDRRAAFSLPRSQRLNEGTYAAICMQPLFHRNEYAPELESRMHEIESEITFLRNELVRQLSPSTQKTLETIYYLASAYIQWTPAEIENRIEELVQIQASLVQQMETSEKCKKYAKQAIYNQQNCPRLVDASIETQADVKCCGHTCYKQQRICGLLYKIDCCATRCWAIDCFFYMCCIWPDGRRYCWIP